MLLRIADKGLCVTITSFFRRLPRDQQWLGLALGAGLLALAVSARFFFGGLAGGFEPMVLLPAMLLAGLFGGIRVGLGVCLVGSLLAWVWYFPPYGTFILSPHDAITMAVFVLTAVLELCVVRVLNVTINDLASAREHSNTLFQELQHRVANNLQFAAALLYATKKTFEIDSAGAHAIDAVQGRLELMSRVHRRLHNPASVGLPIDRYLEDLCKDLIEASASPYIRAQVDASHVRIDINSLISVSLIVVELVTNSLKHAFRDRTEGNIVVNLTEKKEICTLVVADDGCGISSASNRMKTTSLGQGILQSLTSQLHGTITFESGPGTTVRIIFPSPGSPG